MHRLSHPVFWLIIVLFGVDGLFFGLTDPHSITSFGLIVGFGLFAATLYCLIKGLLRLASWYGLPVNRHRRRLSAALVGLVCSLLALQSIGELGPHDVVVLSPLIVVAYLYISYNRDSKRQTGNISKAVPQ
ncbi:MAG: hypothetical protein WA843_01210 [Candidatus Saccharimonadales bacterium]